jgi:AraC-like DNA-binding protein
MQDLTHNFHFLAIFSAGIIGLILSAILLFVNRERSLVSNLLAGVVLTLSLLLMTNAAYLTDFFLHFPKLWRALAWLSFCIGPVSYLYVRSVLTQSFRLRYLDLLFFLPALLYFLHRLPFGALSEVEKLRVVEDALRDKRLVAAEPEGFLPPGWAAVLRIIVGMMFMAAQSVMLWKWKQKHLDDRGNVAFNRDIFRWLVSFTLVLSASYVLVLIETGLQLLGGYTLGDLIVATIAFAVLFIAGYLFVQPRILYGMIGWMQEPEPVMALPTEIPGLPETDKGARQTLTMPQGLAIKEALERHFNEKKPFCRLRYTIRDLSEEIKIPAYQLSAFINQEYGKNFNEFINDARIGYMADILSKDPHSANYTFEALSRQAGFNSRNSFIKAVKRQTGMTPSEYFMRKDD